MPSPTVYILSAEMDGDSFAWLDGLRRQHFPPARNVLSAHLTLFHQLSPEQAFNMQSLVMPDAPLPVSFERAMFLGAGVAIRVRSAELERCRDELRIKMGGPFSGQDSQSWRPHVTIQNKVKADVARAFYDEFQQSFVARPGTITGLLLWEYLGGPWKLARRISFDRAVGSPAHPVKTSSVQ